MPLASAGSVFDTIANNVLWILVLCGIVFFLFVGWVFKWENDREQRERNRPHNSRWKNGKRER